MSILTKKKSRPKKPFHKCQGTMRGRSNLFTEKFPDDGSYWEITDLAPWLSRYNNISANIIWCLSVIHLTTSYYSEHFRFAQHVLYFNSNSRLLVYPHAHDRVKEGTTGRDPQKLKASEVNMLRIHLCRHLGSRWWLPQAGLRRALPRKLEKHWKQQLVSLEQERELVLEVCHSQGNYKLVRGLWKDKTDSGKHKWIRRYFLIGLLFF